MSEFERLCPECGENLNKDARQCACGWGKRKVTERIGKVFDHRCTFRTFGDRCEYPVGWFEMGATTGWCIFHRNALPGDGTPIVEQSRSVPYAQAIKPIIARNADNPNVRALRERIAAKRGDPQRVGSVLAESLPEREPGADEAVA